MTKPTFEDTLTFLEDQDIKLYHYQKEMLKSFWENEVIRSFQTSYKPLEGQLIYISSADMHDNPFIKMVKKHLAENTKENENA